MAAIDTLLATQQAPNLLGAFNRGQQVAQSQELGQLQQQQQQFSLQQQQQQAPVRNRLLDLQGQRQEQVISETDRRADEDRFKDLITKTSTFIGDITDPQEFEDKINSATFLDDEAKGIALQFGPDGVRRASEQVLGSRSTRKRVQSSNILADGTVQLVFNDGSVDIVSAGEAGKRTIADAEARGSEIQAERAQSRQLGKDAAKTAQSSFEQVNSIRGNVRNLKEVIRLVSEEGADTGPLAKRLPSITAAAQKLDNIRNRLGLDVISGVVFGALSQGELDLALDTALPTGLQGPDLIKWAQDRINAQEKLSEFYENAASFLSTPGNTTAGFLESRRAPAEPQSTAQPAQIAQPAQPANVGRFQIEVVQ